MVQATPKALWALAALLFTWSSLAASIKSRGSGGLFLDLADLGVDVTKRQTNNLAGYLGAFFLGADPYVYFYLSNGNDALSFRALNRGQPVIRPTKGTTGVRDPTIVPGGGSESGRKWYIIGTDLHIGRVCSSK